MMMKNKLYKHHRNKALFLLRKFSFVLMGFVGAVLLVVIPTYISSIQDTQISTQAKTQETAQTGLEENLEPNQGEELLSYK